MINTGQYSAFLAPRDNATSLRERVDTLSQELSSGFKSDVGAFLRSDFSRVSQAAHDFGTQGARAGVLAQGGQWGAALQRGLEAIDGSLRTFSDSLPSTVGAGALIDTAAVSQIGGDVLSDILNRLSESHGGRALFANGQAVAPGLPSADDIQADLRPLIAASTDVDDALSIVADYFGAGGAFELATAGVSADPVRFVAGPADKVTFDIDAQSDGFRQGLIAATSAALLQDMPFALEGEARDTVSAALTDLSARGQSDLVKLRAAVGTSESRLADMEERFGATAAAAESELSDALTADPYATATRLQEEMSRLETTYAITARRSRLTLTEYL